LAELEFTSDFSSVTVAIRNDAFWSGGTPVTADDLMFSVDVLRSAPANAIYRQNVANIAAVTRINSRTVQMRFYHPSPMVGIDLGFPIIPRHHYQGQNMNRHSMAPLGNGPFLFESYTPMQNVALAQNPTSFRQLSLIQNIEVIFLPDAQTELYAFDQGRIDAIYLPLTEWVRHHSVRHPGYEIFPAMYFEFIGFNHRNDIFDNLHVRQGIAHAFNADEAIPAVYLTHAVRAVSPIHPNSFVAGGASALQYDPGRARALLNAANITRPLAIIVNGDNPQRVSIGARLAASLNAIGVPARMEALHYTDYFARLEDGDFDLFIGGMNLALTPDMSVFFTEQEGALFIANETLQASFDAVQNAATQADYLQAISQFQQDFAAQLPVISLAFRHSAVLTNRHIAQNHAPAPDNVFGWVNLWQVE
jgi:peptide/nickel transport system substrate-binding protein